MIAGVFNRNGMSQTMTRDDRDFIFWHTAEFRYLNLRKI